MPAGTRTSRFFRRTLRLVLIILPKTAKKLKKCLWKLVSNPDAITKLIGKHYAKFENYVKTMRRNDVLENKVISSTMIIKKK